MDHSFLPRSIWTSDSKFLQHSADLYTSVIVTRSIPAGTSFGPCVLQNTFYETIAFIAQKSCDKMNKSYVFRVSLNLPGKYPVYLSLQHFNIQKTCLKSNQINYD